MCIHLSYTAVKHGHCTWMILKGWLHSRCGSTDVWAVFHGQRREQINMSFIIWMLPSPWWKTLNQGNSNILAMLKGIKHPKKCSGRGYRGKKMQRTSAQCLVWQHKGVDRKECDCMQCGSPEQNRMEVHSRQPSDWRRHLIGLEFTCTVDSCYNKLHGTSEITLLYQGC